VQIRHAKTRARLRRQLPSNIFVQFLAGPSEVRFGIIGFMLRSIAWISFVVAPVSLLILFQVQFLPYHDEAVSWWQRIVVLLDLVLLWALWPSIVRGTTAWLHWQDFCRPTIAGLLVLSVVPVWLVFGVATFPGERLDALTPDMAFEWTPHKLLVAGEVDETTQRPRSLWANRLALPGIDLPDIRHMRGRFDQTFPDCRTFEGDFPSHWGALQRNLIGG
jgi:hypothetical protein